MLVRLNDNFWLEIGVYRNGNQKKYYPTKIVTDEEEIICREERIMDFIELLSAFVANQLVFGKIYGFFYKDDIGGGFKAYLAEDDGVYLRIETAKTTYKLDKYQCRIIVANAKMYLSKCTPQDLL